MTTGAAIPRRLQETVERELEPGERIKWMDMPIRELFTPASTAVCIAGILITAFAVLWTVFEASEKPLVSLGSGGFGVFAFFGIPFVLLGLGMMSSPLWARRKTGKTVYVITDRRAITFDGGWSTTIRSYPPNKLKDMHRKEKKDGSGDVVFTRQAYGGSEDGQLMELGFLRVRDVKEVEGMLRKLAERPQAASQE
jgi:hypothetical protein